MPRKRKNLQKLAIASLKPSMLEHRAKHRDQLMQSRSTSCSATAVANQSETSCRNCTLDLNPSISSGGNVQAHEAFIPGHNTTVATQKHPEALVHKHGMHNDIQTSCMCLFLYLSLCCSTFFLYRFVCFSCSFSPSFLPSLFLFVLLPTLAFHHPLSLSLARSRSSLPLAAHVFRVRAALALR